LTNTNESATVAKSKNFRELNTPFKAEVTPPISLFAWAENKRLKVLLTDLYERKILLADRK
jgi:hypothetical protein